MLLDVLIFKNFFSSSDFLKKEIYHNTVGGYFFSLLLFFVFLIIFGIFQKIVLSHFEKLAKKTKTDLDDTFIEIIKKIKPPFYAFLAFWLAIKSLTIGSFLAKVINAVLIIWVVYLVIEAIQIVLDYWLKKRSNQEQVSSSRASLVSKIIKWILWSFGLLLVLDNLGVNITSLVAGLGIGGIAVALAVQNVLGDLLSSFAIFFDKPFVEGDFIVVGNEMGIVEKIGIKTTRLRSLQGEEIVVPNKELTSATIHNFKRMQERRIVFNLGVVYNTSQEKMKKIPQIIKEIFAKINLARLDRVHFKEFGDSALIFEIVYYVSLPDYNAYMDTNQEILLNIKEEFEKENIEMAYPTQTIYLAKN